MPGCPTCPGERYAGHANHKPRLSPFPRRRLDPANHGELPPARAVVQHVKQRNIKPLQPPGRHHGLTQASPGLRHGCRNNFCPFSVVHPIPERRSVAGNHSPSNSALDTYTPNQFDINSPRQHAPNSSEDQLIPKNAWPFYPGASEPLLEHFVCRPASSLSDHGDADLCQPLIRCRVGPQPLRSQATQHVETDALIGPHASLSMCPSHEEHLARYRWQRAAGRSACCVSSPGDGKSD